MSCDTVKVFCGVPQGMSSVYFNKGENCIAAGRLFVEESIHDEFISRVVREGQRSKGNGDLTGASKSGAGIRFC